MKNKENNNVEKKNKKYKIAGRVAGGALVLGLLATGLKGCENSFQERSDITNNKETDLDEKEQESTTEIESTTVVETEEYSEEETSYSEWGTENIYTEDLGQARNNADTNIESEMSNTIVEEEIETTIETEMQTESENESETQKETESASSSESESSSESSEDDKSEEEKHEHNFKTVSVDYLDCSSGEYHFATYKKKCECGEARTIKKKEQHEFTDFASIGKEGEEQHCPKCEHENIIEHDVTIYTLFTDNGNGTHERKEIEKCNRDYCGYEEVVSKKNEQHDCTEYVSIGDIGEESHCKSEGCGFVQTREHKNVESFTYDSLEDHKHAVRKNTKCENGCGHETMSTSIEDCIHEQFTSKGVDYEVSVCPKCEDELERKHPYGDAKIEYIPNYDGSHITRLTYECPSCDEMKTVDTKENCVGNWISAGTVGETQYCPVCEATSTRDHNLVMKGEVKYTGDGDSNHKHAVETDWICQNEDCGYQTHTSETYDCTMNYKDNGENEIAKCPGCEKEITRGHDMKTTTTTEYTGDNKDKNQHTTTTKNECQNEGCGHIDEDSKTVDCTMNYKDNEENELAKCPSCEKEITREHDMKTTTTTEYTGNNKDKNQHTTTTKNECQNEGCGHIDEDSKTVDCTMNYKDNGENELAKCPDCEKEITKDHNMKRVTTHIDNADGETHELKTSDVCQNDYCKHEEPISKVTEAHTPNGSWVNNGDAGEKNICSAEGCNGEMKRDHDLSGEVIGTGEYHYIGNKQHVEGGKKVCGNEGCDYEKVIPLEEATPENCDLTGEKKTEPNGEDITVTCPKCEHPEIVHTHYFIKERMKKESYDPKNHTVTQKCDAKYDDGSACTYSNVPIDEPHNLVPTGVENTDEQPGMMEMHCETNEHGVGCGEFVWIAMTDTKSNSEDKESEEQINDEATQQTSVEIPEEQESHTENVEKENTEAPTEVIEEEQQESSIDNSDPEMVETVENIEEEVTSEEIVEEAIEQVIEEIVQEVLAESKEIQKENLTLSSKKPLAKNNQFMYTIYNEYIKKKRRHYC